MSFRLNQNSKVLKPYEYKAIFNDGKITKGKYWQRVARRISSPKPRLGLAISKKVQRLAVDRNRYKRVAREAFRLNQNTLSNWEFVIMAKHSKPANNQIISKDLLSLFNKITNN